MVEGEKIIFRGGQVEKKASEYINISSLNMPSHKYEWPDSLEQDNFLKIIDKYRNLRNIKLIEAKNNSQISRFIQINIDKVKKLYQSLDVKKKKPCKRMVYHQSTKQKCRLFFAKDCTYEIISMIQFLLKVSLGNKASRYHTNT